MTLLPSFIRLCSPHVLHSLYQVLHPFAYVFSSLPTSPGFPLVLWLCFLLLALRLLYIFLPSNIFSSFPCRIASPYVPCPHVSNQSSSSSLSIPRSHSISHDLNQYIMCLLILPSPLSVAYFPTKSGTSSLNIPHAHSIAHVIIQYPIRSLNLRSPHPVSLVITQSPASLVSIPCAHSILQLLPSHFLIPVFPLTYSPRQLPFNLLGFARKWNNNNFRFKQHHFCACFVVRPVCAWVFIKVTPVSGVLYISKRPVLWLQTATMICDYFCPTNSPI